VRGGDAGEIARYAIIIAIFLAANAGAAEIDSPRHPFPLRRTDHTRLYPKAWVTTTARDQAVLDRATEGRFPGYYRYLATRSYRHNRLKLHNRSAALTSISTDQPRVSKFRAQVSTRAARTSRPSIRTTSQTQASTPAASAKPPTGRADQPTVGIFSAPQPASTTTVTESNYDEHGSAFALSPAPALAEPPSPPAEPQQQSQQEKTQQTPSAEMGKEEPSTTLADLLTPLLVANQFSAVRASLRW
jgi:hypothetical protein